MDTSELYKLPSKRPVIITDSRDCPEDNVSFASEGTSFNGNELAQSALEKGCAYTVTDQKGYQIQEDERYILAEDYLQTLKQLVSYHRRALDAPTIGITGTNGKTIAKELLATVLARRFNIWCAQGNFNNEIGMPKTLLCLKPEHEMVVVEMSASHPSGIRSLVTVAEPDCALVTNVGCAYLQGFGSFEGVMHTKAELHDYMQQRKSRGLVLINQDSEYLKGMFRAHYPNVKAMGYVQIGRPDISIRGEVVNCAPYLKSRWRKAAVVSSSHENTRWHEIQIRLIDTYNLDNMLVAITIGSYFDVSDEQINRTLAGHVPSDNRSQSQIMAHNKPIVNAYNANPTSMGAVLTNSQHMDVPKKMAILGDVHELGDVSVAEHQKIVDLVAILNPGKVWLMGEEFDRINTTLRKFKDTEAAREVLRRGPPQGYYVFIKGSSGIKLF